MKAIPILVIAVVQGWLLYGLHYSLEHKSWPSTDTSALLALYALALFVPVALEIFASRLRQPFTWMVAATIAVVAGGLGAYTGWVAGPPGAGRFSFALVFALYAALFAAWFHALPFAQARARRGSWKFLYSDLFEFSWQNALLLAEAALFTGIFWMMLGLWAALFRVVEIKFFAELFSQPAFIYPVTSIAFGYAIYLIESHERIVVTLRRHLLGVFSWLLPLIALIAFMFVLALPFTGLQPLWKTGLASSLMLWLQFLFIYFLNAAYEDGQSEPRYPAWLKLAVRVATFALPVYAALCAYSLGLRVEQYGWTVARAWGAIGTFIMAAYAIGYAVAALRRSPWMGRIAPINVAIALMLIIVLLLATSPLLDPRRVAADSQVARLRAGTVTAAKFDYDYLRFELGRYGKDALAELARDANQEIAGLAAAALAKTQRHGEAGVPAEMIATRIELMPAGARLDPDFIQFLQAGAREKPSEHPRCLTQAKQDACLMLALDLNGDGRAEILTLNSYPNVVYSRVDGKWKGVAVLTGPLVKREPLEKAIGQGRVKAAPAPWQDLRIGDERYAVEGFRE
jgi:hypothetical protein